MAHDSAARTTLQEVQAQDAADGIQPRRRAKGGRKRHHAPEVLDDLAHALERFPLIQGTEDFFDKVEGTSMRSNALRLMVGPEVHKALISSPLKRLVLPSQIVFDPTEQCGEEYINLYRGIAMQPLQGDHADLLDLLVFLCEESADTNEGRALVLNFVLDWLAFPLQNPGAKMATAVVTHGPQGCGKNLFWEAIARMYGRYAVTVGQEQLESKYNGIFSQKLFVIGDEVLASYELGHKKNVLKALVTSPKILIEEKFKAVRVESNHMNIVFLSNEHRPLALERDDRRHLVIYCPPKRDKAFYTRVVHSLDHGAVESFYAFLMRRDLSGFNAHTPPPMTRAKEELIEIGLKPAERFTKEWLGKELDLPVWACSTGQLYQAFLHWCKVNGDRLPPNQPTFTALARKYAGHRLDRKTTSPSPTESGSPIVLILPAGTGAREGVRWYDFAKHSVDAFEPALDTFRSASRGIL